jgi:hypothetical protein
MIVQEYVTCAGVICEYKNCQQEADFIQVADDSEEAYENGKLRCKQHKTA